jgi:hypothetical protein
MISPETMFPDVMKVLSYDMDQYQANSITQCKGAMRDFLKKKKTCEVFLHSIFYLQCLLILTKTPPGVGGVFLIDKVKQENFSVRIIFQPC